jgi:PPM family protein phosphatase
MYFQIKAICDRGLVRARNEDKILIPGNVFTDGKHELDYESKSKAVFAVADGLGGHKGGDIASMIVLECLQDFVSGLPENLATEGIGNRINLWANEVFILLKKRGMDNPGLYNMGTTLTGLLYYYDDLFWFNAGDSRIYHYSKEGIVQLSTDHVLKQQSGYFRFPSNALTNSIGGGKGVFVDFEKIIFNRADENIFFLCSDGLTNMVDIDEVKPNIEKLDADWIVELAKKRGGVDNISVLLVKIQVK